jgi:hypothetical protein
MLDYIAGITLLHNCFIPIHFNYNFKYLSYDKVINFSFTWIEEVYIYTILYTFLFSYKQLELNYLVSFRFVAIFELYRFSIICNCNI